MILKSINATFVLERVHSERSHVKLCYIKNKKLFKNFIISVKVGLYNLRNKSGNEVSDDNLKNFNALSDYDAGLYSLF